MPRKALAKAMPAIVEALCIFFARFKVGGFYRVLQVLEDDFDGLQREAVGVVVGERGDVGFYRVGEHVHAGVGGDVRRHGHDEGGVNDGDAGGERVVGQRVFAVVLFVGDDGKRRHFRTGAGGGRDADVFGFFAQLREFEGAFADVHEFLHEVAEINLWLFVKHLHDFCRIHDGTAARRTQYLRRLANPVFSLLGADPVFTPLGEPSVFAAW